MRFFPRFWKRDGIPARVRTPTLLQMEAVECGAASLGIMLGHFGRFVPLEELRIACGVSRDGSNAASIVKAARRYGLTARGLRRDAERVLKGPFPVIAFWNFNHFLVLEGVRRDRVFLNDPALGPRTVTRAEFARAYCGIILELSPGPDFVRKGQRPRLLPQLARRIDGLHGTLAFVAALSLFLVVPGILVPGFTKVFVDDVLVRGDGNWLRPLLIGLGATFLVRLGLTWLQQDVLSRIQMRLALVQSAVFMWHVLRLPVVFFTQRHLGDVVNRVEGNDRVATLLAGDLGSAVLNVLTAGFFAIVMASYDPVLTGIAAAGALMNAAVLKLVQRTRQDAAQRLQADQGKLFGTSVVGLKTIETLKATGGEDDFFAKWAGYHARALNTEQTLGLYDQATTGMPRLLLGVVTAVVLGLGALRAMDGILTIGSLVAFQSLMAGFTGPIQSLVQVAGKAQQASADLARLDDVLRHPLDHRHGQPAAPTPSPPAAGRLELRNLSFGYSALEPPLLNDFSLEVEPGGWVALVGGSGSGKSTIGRLISGLYQPWSGEVLIDGRPLTAWNSGDLAATLATVDQDIRLFDGTVRENLCLWDDTVPHTRVVAATRDAELLPLIESMPGNHDGRVEEGGRNLSGGQRQRLEIARALLRDPAILVLDEATSALDPVTEVAVLEAIRRRGCTCILVAHRLSTIRDCDEIIVLDAGRIVERGKHADLLARGGAYAELISEEAGA